jgi:hypothetical protein
MTDLLELVSTWGVGTVLTTAALFGFFPKFMMHLIVLVYPPDHPRRRELPAELAALPHRNRLMWVGEQLATMFFDAVPARTRDVRARRRAQARLSRKRSNRWGQLGGKRVAPERARKLDADAGADMVVNDGDTTYLLEVKRLHRP